MSLPLFEDLGEIKLTDEGLASLKGITGGEEPDQIKLTDEQVKNLREGLGLSGYDVDAKPLSVKDYAEKNPFSATKDETLTYDQRLRAAIEAQKQMRGPKPNVRAAGSEEVNLGGGDWLPHKLITGGETRPGEVVAGAVRRLPVAGGVFRMLEQREFNSAIDRIGKGKATEQDFHKLASSALDMDQAERASMLKKAGDTLSYIPGFVTEMWLTGGVAKVAGQGARAAALTGARAVGGKAGIALARGSKTIGTIGGGIAQGAALPSVVLPTIAQQQQDEIGQDSAGQVVVTDNQTGTGTAIARGVAAGAAEAVSERLGGKIDEGLGALGRLFGRKPGVLGNIIASHAAKKIKPSGLGEFIQSAPAELVEERVTEGINLVTGVDTSGGVLGNLARGEFGAAGEQLGVEALAFGTLNAGQTTGNFIDAAAEGAGKLAGKRSQSEQVVVDTMTNPKIARELVAAADAAGMGQQLRDMVTVEKPSRRQFASLGLPYLDEAGRAEAASVIRDVLAVQQQAEAPDAEAQETPAAAAAAPTMSEALADSAKEFEKVYGGGEPVTEPPKAKKKYSTWSDKRLEAARKSAADAISGLDPSDPQYSSFQREAESIGLEIERRSKKKGANNGEESSDGRQAGEEVNQKVRDQEAQGQVAPATETPPRDQQPDMPVAGPVMQAGGDAESAPAPPPASSGPSAQAEKQETQVISPPAQPAKPGVKFIGYSKKNQKLYEDDKGVRSYEESGILVTEPVQMIPTRQGMQIAKDRTRRPEYELDEPVRVEVTESPDLQLERRREEDKQRRLDWIKEKNIEVGDTVHSPVGAKGGVVEGVSPDGFLGIRFPDGSSLSGGDPKRYVVKTKAKPPEPAPPPPAAPAKKPSQMTAAEVAAKVREKMGLGKPDKPKPPSPDEPATLVIKPIFGGPETKLELPGKKKSPLPNRDSKLPDVPKEQPAPAPEPAKPMSAKEKLAERARKLREQQEKGDEDQRYKVGTANTRTGLRPVDRAEIVRAFPGRPVQQIPGGWRVEIGSSHVDIIKEPNIPIDWAEVERRSGREFGAAAKKAIESARGLYSVRLPDGKLHDGLGLIRLREETAAALGQMDPRQRDRLLVDVGNQRVLAHEALHLAKRAGLLTDAEWSSLVDKYANGVSDPYMQEEMIASARERWDASSRSIWRRILAFIRDLLSAIGVKKTADDVFDLMDTRAFWSREGIPVRRSSNFADEYSRTQDSYSLPDGVLKNDDGTPKVLYHGSPVKGIKQFRPGRTYGLFGPESYFTDNEKVAKTYDPSGTGQIYRAHLSMQKPLDMDAPPDSANWDKIAEPGSRVELKIDSAATNEDMFRALEQDAEMAAGTPDPRNPQAWAYVKAKLQAMGYDGITHFGGSRVRKPFRSPSGQMVFPGDTHQVWIPLSPSQIIQTGDQDFATSLSDEDSAELVSMAIDAGAEYVQGGGSTYEGWISDLRGAMPDGDLRLIRPSLEQAWGIMRDMFDPGTLGEVGNLDTILGGGGDEKDTGTEGNAGLGAGSGLPGGTATGDAGGSPEVGDAGGSPGQGDAADIRGTGGRGGGRSPRGAGIGNADTGVSGQPGEGGTDGTERPGAEPVGGVQEEKRNYVIGSDQRVVTPGTVGKIRAAIAALEVLSTIERENRLATESEKAIIAAYPGMGPIKEVLNQLKGDAYQKVKDGADSLRTLHYDENWSKNYGEHYLKLRSLLSEDEFRAAAASVRNAHYTDPQIVRSIWAMAAKLGIPSGAKILEPGAGVGYFVGMSPVANNANFTMVERDITSGRILKALYPASEVINQDMNKAKLRNGTYDLAIGNVPFSEDTQSDSKRRYGKKLNLHNYFIARSLDALRPGGVAILITTHHTLDSRGEQRELLAAKGNLIAAIRLPKTSFQANANTDVVTDILVIQRPLDPTAPRVSWRNTRSIETDGGKYRADVNEWIAGNPDFVLGKHSMTGEMFATEEGKEYTLLPNPGQDLKEAVRAISERLPRGIVGESEGGPPSPPIGESDAGDGIPSGSVFLKGGDLWMKFDDRAVKWSTEIDIPDGYPKGLSYSTVEERAKQYIAIRDQYADVRRIQNDPEASDGDVNAAIAALSATYDTYVKKHGALGGGKTGVFTKDPEFYNVIALENVKMKPDENGKLRPEYTKSDILKKRTMYPPKTPDSAETIEEAVGISIASQSAINVPLISRLIRKEQDQVTSELLEKRLAFLDPESSEVVDSGSYLSGAVRVKLRKAEAAAEDDPRFEANVESLKAVVPATVFASSDTLYLKSTFIPDRIVQRWARTLLGEDGLRVVYIEGADKWRVSGATGSVENNSVFGIQEISGHEILEKAMNGSQIRLTRSVRNSDGSRTVVFLESETQRANEIREQIEDRWLKWIGASSNREAYIEVNEAFNQKHNGWVDQKFDGSEIPLHGLSTAFTPRFYQRNAVARILRAGHAMLAHAVGAGKTLSMIMAAMEMRRLGKARRPMIVVQNATLGQFAHAFAQAYPNARIMVADSKDLQTSKRKAFLARIVSGDWDSVIIAQSTFDRLKMSPEATMDFYRERIDELLSALADADDEMTTREIENQIASIQRKIDDILDKQSKKENDDLITFEELGIDALFIDEAHAYKKPLFATKIGNIVGLNKEASAAGTSTLMKVRHIQGKTRGRNVVMATGTPVTNTFGEVWHMINFTAPDILRDAGVSTFDRFASTFGVIGQVLVTNAGGQPVFKPGFKRFTHRNEFSQLIRGAWDVLSPDDLRAYFDEDAAVSGKESGLPSLRGGDVRPVIVPLSDGNREFNDFVKRVYERYQDMPPRERRNFNWVAAMLYQASRAAAIDIRLVFPSAKEEENSIINVAAKNIYKEYVDSSENKGTQMVFSDVNNTFDMTNLHRFASGIDVGIAMEQEPEDPVAYEKWRKDQAEMEREREASGLVWSEVIKKLVALGIPRNEIAIVAQAKTDAARKQLFDRMKSGDVRVLLGSTAKMGVGVNVQDLMTAQHQLDAPWLPADVEQRIGRIVRFGNQNRIVSVQRYAMEDTLSAGIYMATARKARMIWQAMQGGGGTDQEFEDPASGTSLSMDQVAAMINKNPHFMRRLELQQIIKSLKLSQEGHTAAIQDIRNEIEMARSNIEYTRKRLIPQAEQTRDNLTEIIARPLGAVLDGVTYDDPKELGKKLEPMLAELQAKAEAATKSNGKENYEGFSVPIYGGEIVLKVYGGAKQTVSFDGTVRVEGRAAITPTYGDIEIGRYKTVRGALESVVGMRDTATENIAKGKARIETQEKRAAELTPQLSRPWERISELEAAEAELDSIDAAMTAAAARMPPPAAPPTTAAPSSDQPGDSDMYSLPEDIPTPTRPELSQLSGQNATRAQLAEADKTWSRQRRTEEEIAQQVQQRLQDDRAGERAKYDAFLRQPGKSFATWTDAEVAKVFMDEDAAKFAKTASPERWGDIAERYHAWRDAGTAAGQILRARRDPLETPGQRWARVVAEALMTPADDRRKDIEDARKRVFDAQKGVENAEKSPAVPDPEELARLKAVLDAALAELDALKKRIGTEMLSLKERLAELGVDIDNLSENGYTRDSALRAVRLIASMRSSWSDALYEYWRNAILSGPLTQIVNVTGGIAHAGYHYLLKRPLEIQLQNAIATMGESNFAKFVDRITGGFVTATIGPPPAKHERLSVAREYRFIARGMAAGLVRGAMNAMITLSTETDEFEEQAQRSGRMTGGSGDLIGRAANVSISETPVLETVNAVRALLKMPRMKPNAATSFLDYLLSGRNVRLPQRMIGAADVFVKSMVAEMEAHSRAYQLAQLSAAPGADFATIAAMTEQLVLDERNTVVWGPAYDFGRFISFQQEGGEAAQFVKSIGKRFQGNKYGRWLVPFNATPVNLLETGLRYSPLGTIGLLGDVRRNMRSGRPALEGVGQKAIEQFLAMATLLLIWLANDPEDPWITGATAAAQPEDERPAGAPPPFSFRSPVNGEWISYSRIEPFATMLGTTVDAGFALRRSLEGDIEESATTALKSMTGQMSSKTYLLQLGSLIKAFNSADTGGKLVEGAITFPHSFVPNAVRQPILKSEGVSMQQDIRGATAGERLASAAERLGQKSQLIGGQVPKFDKWGLPIERSTASLPWRLLVPADVQPGEPYAGDKFIRAWNLAAKRNGWQGDGWNPEIPRPYWTDSKGERHAMTDEQYSVYLGMRGDLARYFFEDAGFDPNDPQEGDKDQVSKLLSKSTSLTNEFFKSRWEKGQADAVPTRKDVALAAASDAIRTLTDPLPTSLPPAMRGKQTYMEYRADKIAEINSAREVLRKWKITAAEAEQRMTELEKVKDTIVISREWGDVKNDTRQRRKNLLMQRLQGS